MTRPILLFCSALTSVGALATGVPAQGGQFLDTIADREQASPIVVTAAQVLLGGGTLEANTNGGPAPTQVRIFWGQSQVLGAAVNLPPGRIVRDFELGEFNGDGQLDLVVMSTDATGTGPGSLLVYLDVLGDQQPDHTIGALGPGLATYAAGSLEICKTHPGGPSRFLVADPGYTVGGLAQTGMLVSVDVLTGQPAVNWGWQGTQSQARFGDALAARDPVVGIGGAVILGEPGYQGPQGDQGRVWAIDPASGTLWWNVEGPAGSRLGTEAAFNVHWALVSNPDADHVGLNQTGNGAVLHIDLRTVTGIVDFGLPGERLGVDVAAYGGTHAAVASDREVQIFPLGSGTASHRWNPVDHSARSEPRNALIVRDVPNFDDPVITFQTAIPTSTGPEHWLADVTTDAALRSDIFQVPIPLPNVVNIVIEENALAGGFAVVAASFGTQLGDIEIPGISGVLTLTPPIFGLGSVFLDAAGFGIYTMPWAGHPGYSSFDLTFSAVGLPPPSASTGPQFLNHVQVHFGS